MALLGVKTGRWDGLRKENMQELEQWRDGQLVMGCSYVDREIEGKIRGADE